MWRESVIVLFLLTMLLLAVIGLTGCGAWPVVEAISVGSGIVGSVIEEAQP